MTIRTASRTMKLTVKKVEELYMLPRRSFTRDGMDYDIKVGEETLATYSNSSIANDLITRIKEALKGRQKTFNLPYEGPITVFFN